MTLLELREKERVEKDWDKKHVLKAEIKHLESLDTKAAEAKGKAEAGALVKAMEAQPMIGLLTDKILSVGTIIGKSIVVHGIWAITVIVTTYIIAVLRV
jgi:phosphoenolpyruvate synthase/pyruvate phosphate dikinase